jgi:hypothetical protein
MPPPLGPLSHVFNAAYATKRVGTSENLFKIKFVIYSVVIRNDHAGAKSLVGEFPSKFLKVF